MWKKKIALFIALLQVIVFMPINQEVDAASTLPSDVVGHWAQAEIDKMLDREIFPITENEDFGPDTVVTRGEFAYVLAKLFNQSAEAADVFADINSSHKYSASVAAVKKAGFIPSAMVSGNKFYPETAIQVSDAKSMLSKAFVYAYQMMAPEKICSVIAKNGTVVAPTGTLTRAQLAVIAYNLFCIDECYPDVAYKCKSMPGIYENSELSEEVDDAYLRGARKVIMQPGTYYLYGEATRMKNSGRNTHFGLAEVNDFTLEGYDVKFIACTPSDGTTGTSKDRCVMVFRECENLTVRGFTTDFKDIIYTQAEVVKIEEANNANYITVVVDEGYPNQLDDPLYFPASVTGYIYDPVTKLPKEKGSTINLSPQKVEGEERTWRCQNWNPSTMKFFEVGDMVVFRMNACGPINTSIQYCRNITMEDYTVHSGHMGILNEPSMLRENGEVDNVYFRNVRVTFGPKPEGATRDRLVTTYADAFRFAYISGHVTMEDCLAEGATDDLLSFHARHYMVTDLGENDNEFYIGTPSYGIVMREGDNFAFYDESSNLKGTAKIVSVEEVTENYTPQSDAADINGYALATFYKVKLEDNNVGVNRLDFAFDIDASSGGFVVRDSTFRNSTARGCLVQAWNGLFENNTYENLGAGLQLIGEKFCAQGPYAKDIVIRNCSFKGCSRYAEVKSGLFMPGASVSSEIEETGLANQNFVIEGCYFEGNYGEDIHIGNTQNVILKDNIFAERNEFMDGLIVRGEPSVKISASDKVYFDESNVALTNRPFVTYADVSNLTSSTEPLYSSELKTSVNNSEGEEWTFEYSPVGSTDYYKYNHQYWSSGTWVKVIPLWSQNIDNNSEYGFNSSQFEWVPGSKNDIVITYTAPYSGKVKVMLNDGLKIKEGKYNSNGVNIKILKGENENIWPTMGWYRLPYGRHVEYIEDIYVNVEKGDKIRFRINANGETGVTHDVVMICPEIRYVTPTFEAVTEEENQLKLDTQYKAIYGTGAENAVKIGVNQDGVLWSSSNEHVATVAADGTVIPKNSGVSIITASYNGEKEDCIISVREIKGNGIELEKRFVSGRIGETIEVPVVLKGDATLNGAVWNSSDTKVADVDGQGRIVLKTLGSAVITVTAGDYTASVTVFVDSADSIVALNKNYAELNSPQETLKLQSVNFT